MSLTTVQGSSQVLSIDNTGGGVSLTVPSANGPASAKMCVIDPIETGTIRFTTDPDVTVTASRGHLIAVGSTIEIWGDTDMRNFRAIRATSTTGAAEVTYER